MVARAVQFAVVREDPLVESTLIQAKSAHKVLLIGSGGCSALSLQSLFPDLHIALVDQNPAQLDLIRHKVEIARRGLHTPLAKAALNIENSDATAANACGNFEALFRCFANFCHEFIVSRIDLHNAFKKAVSFAEIRDHLIGSRYWPVAFQLHFHDVFLHTMFGPGATQHAYAGSYPKHFQGVLEKGLRRSDAVDNYFLHHIFLGHYLDRPSALPIYLQREFQVRDMPLICGGIHTVLDLDKYDLISISNVFDWMSEIEIRSLATLLKQKMKAGATLLFRQLNHSKNFTSLLAPEFVFDDAAGERLLESDRSLFYSKINVATRS